MKRVTLACVGALIVPLLVACGGDDPDPTPTPQPTATTVPAAAADLAGVKSFALEHANTMKTATAAYAVAASEYYDLLEAAQFDYQAAYDANPEQIAALLATAKEQWIVASTNYEIDEGIVAGVPSLAYYDVWIDAGPTGEEDPAEALDWQLTLPNGEVMDKPGNFFHHLTEPAVWGTDDAFVALEVDLDGNGTVELGEVMPEANVFTAAATGLDSATAEMIAAIEAWQPTLEDIFTALTTMIPTMNEYFEQWKLSTFVAGEEGAEEVAFVGLSRLFDINGILSGLNVAYGLTSPVVQAQDGALDGQITAGFTDLVAYVSDLYEQESSGARFSAEEADLFGTEAQNRATALAGQVAQAAALLGITLAE
jgi:hypothetical protein